MTAEEFWRSWLLFWLLAGPLLLAAVNFAYSLYLSRRHLGAIKEALKNSRYIYIWGPSLGKRGLIWSLLEMAKITGMIMWPKASLILGELDPVDLKNFPPYLKRRLTVNLKIMIIAFIWMLIGVALLKFR